MTDRTPDQPPTHTTGRKHTAGALDIRNIIGGLIGAYGVILLLMGLFGNEESSKTGGVNANLWAGIVMLAVGLVFLAWAALKPVVVPETDPADRSADGSGGH